MLKVAFIILLIIITSLFTPAFAGEATFFYSDGPWSGIIIDAETKEPIEGVVVLAIWEKYYLGPAGSSMYFLDAIEVLTEKDGKFLIPKFKAFNIFPFAVIEGPVFVIYKPGYATFPGFGAQYFDRYFPKNLKVGSDTLAELFKEGIVLELPKLKTWIERIESHHLADISDAYRIPDTKIPIFTQIIEKEDNYLRPMYKYNREELNIPITEIPK